MRETPIELLLAPQMQAIRQLEQRTRELSLVSAHRRAQAARRIEVLERDLARVALVVRALADLAIERGLFTHDQLRQQFDQADFADGVFDSGLDPQLVAPGATRGGGLAKPARKKAARKPAKKSKRRA